MVRLKVFIILAQLNSQNHGNVAFIMEGRSKCKIKKTPFIIVLAAVVFVSVYPKASFALPESHRSGYSDQMLESNIPIPPAGAITPTLLDGDGIGATIAQLLIDHGLKIKKIKKKIKHRLLLTLCDYYSSKGT